MQCKQNLDQAGDKNKTKKNPINTWKSWFSTWWRGALDEEELVILEWSYLTVCDVTKGLRSHWPVGSLQLLHSDKGTDDRTLTCSPIGTIRVEVQLTFRAIWDFFSTLKLKAWIIDMSTACQTEMTVSKCFFSKDICWMFSDCKGKVCAALINAPPRPTGSQHTLDVNQVTLQETSSYKPGAGPGPGAGPEPGQVQTLCSWWFNHAGAPMKIRTSCLTSRLVH